MEMLIAVGLFIVIVTFALGAILTIFDANRKAQTSKTAVDNFNFGIENMTRVVQFGGFYYCGVSNNITAVGNCSSGGTALSVTFKGNRVIYRFNNGAIERSDDGGASYRSITSLDTKVEYLRFYVLGAGTSGTNEYEQPRVVVVIKGYVGERPTSQTTFSLQTVISQRELDI